MLNTLIKCIIDKPNTSIVAAQYKLKEDSVVLAVALEAPTCRYIWYT
jgi:hypothetical protein